MIRIHLTLAAVICRGSVLVIQRLFRPASLVVLGVFTAAPSWAFTVPSPYASEVLADQPIGYWRLGEEGSETTAVDASPFSRHGVYQDGVARGLRGAIAQDGDTAAQFQATGIVKVCSSAFDLGNDFTLEAWVTNDNPEGYHRVFSTFDNASGGVTGYGFGVFNNNLIFTRFGLQDFFTSIALPADGRYHHLVLAFSPANEAEFYLNGMLQTRMPGSGSVFTGTPFLEIGGRDVGGFTEMWNGNIDEVAVYRGALSPLRVAAHYAAGIPEPSTSVLLLLGLIRMRFVRWPCTGPRLSGRDVA
jgi:hypothetical protein